MKLYIYCEEENFSALASAFENEFESDTDLSAEIAIVDETEIRRLNVQTRGVDSVTDVLSYPSLDGIFGVKIQKKSFPLEVDDDGRLFIGSIAICRKRAEEQAAEYGHGNSREMNYLAAHGVCHLLGYDHIDGGDRAVMRAKEERVLAKIGAVRQ